MTSTTYSSQTSLVKMLASPPKISLPMLGTNSEEIEVVDFDLWVDLSKRAEIEFGEFITTNSSKSDSWNYHISEPSGSFKTISPGWPNDWFGGGNSHTARLAHQIAYGGCIKVEIDSPPTEYILPKEDIAVFWVEWSLRLLTSEKSWG
ncbi:uncharacterized protein N7479_005165 [Penicillium vulpinum]|uniref:uncharacterized protein n=1 Tax=Penicillium vulpinum TaxID=29845 RepID=UPI002548564B|nr:uncharacterized protein N7479_005165 [Penicillium vulpinum]KAJ5958015.1 hypothetical protein N7479_005165 [Penicillium vulpinum]